MSEEPEFFTYTREEFLDEFVHPDDHPALEEARQKRALHVRAEYLTEMRKRVTVPASLRLWAVLATARRPGRRRNRR
jgi:hypothetical protein